MTRIARWIDTMIDRFATAYFPALPGLDNWTFELTPLDWRDRSGEAAAVPVDDQESVDLPEKDRNTGVTR